MTSSVEHCSGDGPLWTHKLLQTLSAPQGLGAKVTIGLQAKPQPGLGLPGPPAARAADTMLAEHASSKDSARLSLPLHLLT